MAYILFSPLKEMSEVENKSIKEKTYALNLFRLREKIFGGS